MGYAKTEDELKQAFPHGARMVRDNQTSIDLISLELDNSNPTTPVLLGWAPPHKDFYIDLDNVLVRKKDWLVFSGGQRISLRPLTEARARQIEEMMD